MKQRMTMFFLILLAVTATVPLRAQVSIGALNTAYTQDFNTLITSGNISWVDNSTVSGWYHTRTGSGDWLVAGDGSSNSGALYSFGTGTTTERALGSVGSGNSAVGDLWWGVRLVNNTGSTITSLSISYYGEQWRYSGTAAAQTVVFSYQTGTNLTSLSSGSWTNVSTFDFTSPIISGSTGALDGNAAANRTLISSTLPVTLNPGDEIMLRWFDDNHSGNDHGLAIDDFSVTALGGSAPTVVEFAAVNSSFDEGAGTVNVNVSITNPDASNATSVDVVLTGGTATNGTDVNPAYATTTLTFPAGSSADQSISLALADDALFEGDETMIFELQNVSGGNSASIGAQTTHTLTILENDPPPTPRVIVNEYYNAYGNISSDEAVELLVTEDGLDMRGWSFSDATSSGNFPYATVTLSNDALWNGLPKGTIIVIGGIFSVPIQDTDPSDGLIMLQAPARNNSNQYFSSHSGGTLAFAGSSDAVGVFDATNTFVHGLAHGSNNQNSMPAGLYGWLNSSLSSATSCFFTRSGASMTVMNFLENTYVDEGNASLAAANDADGNRDFLRMLRSRVFTANGSLAGTFFWDVSVQNGAAVTLSGATNIGNRLFVEEGSFDNNGYALSLDGNGNSENGTGAGDLTVGDDAGTSAELILDMNPSPVSGSLDFNHSDATVVYESATAQTLLNATYFNLTVRNGSQSEPKTVSGALTVNGTLLITGGAWLAVDDPQVIELGPAGDYVNNSRFLGSIRSTRPFLGGVEDFGGIGITLEGQPIINATGSSNAVPGTVTVTMTSGEYIWVGDLPSILRYYEIEDSYPNMSTVTMTVDYAPQDLNGQTESSLGLHHSTDNGTNWSQRTATLNTGANTLQLDLNDLPGVWTMHANPPQGMIMSDPLSLYFETEENGPLPASQQVDIWNAFGNGSIIDWEAVASTIETPTWMSLTPSPAEGVNAGTFTVNITRSDLTPGTHTGEITINDVHAVNHPYVIPVSYRIYEPRKISIGVDTLRIKVSYKRVAVAASIPVINGGESFGPGEIAWSATGGTPWMTLFDTSGMEGDALGIRISALTLLPGTYTGEIIIEGVNSVTNTPIVNSPLTVPVILENEPRDEVVHTVGTLPANSGMSFYNSQGHIIARLDVTSGAIQSMTMRTKPYGLSRNIQRLRYAYRHYIIEATGTYTADLKLYYTLSELGQTGITEPEQLRLWRQIPNLFYWAPFPGYATPVEQSVTGVSLNDLNGIWAMAYPYFGWEWEINANAKWISDNTSRLTWHSDFEVSDLGYIVERSPLDREEWQTVAVVEPSESGLNRFEERLDHGAYAYRVSAFDTNGDGWQSGAIELQPMGILGTDALTAQGFTLGQTAPNPAPLARGSATVEFGMERAADIRLTLHDASGREVAEIAAGRYGAGTHAVRIPLDGLTAGTYFYRLATADGALTRKMVVVW